MQNEEVKRHRKEKGKGEKVKEKKLGQENCFANSIFFQFTIDCLFFGIFSLENKAGYMGQDGAPALLILRPIPSSIGLNRT